jgi:hypothetical protein
VKDFSTEITDTVKNATYIQQRNLAEQKIYNASIGAPLPSKNGGTDMQMFGSAIKHSKELSKTIQLT